jgi:hypothetical protein
VTTLAFAVAGAGGLVGGFVLAVHAGWIFGAPLAVMADHSLRRAAGERFPWHAGLLVAAAVAVALLLAGFLWLLGLGVAERLSDPRPSANDKCRDHQLASQHDQEQLLRSR